ncbi:hypothetical protein ABK040_005301 [Willaertia magna]
MKLFQGDSITIQVIKAFDLIPSDLNGLSDAYVTITNSLNEELNKTAVIKKSLNPQWDATFHYEIKENIDKVEFYFKVYDHDAFSKEDFLGECELSLLDENSLQYGAWYQQELDLNKVAKGRLTICFCIHKASAKQLR